MILHGRSYNTQQPAMQIFRRRTVAEPYRNPPTGPDADRAKMMRVLIPAGVIALVLIVAAVVLSALENKPSPTAKGGGGGSYPQPTGGTDVSKMTDGTDPTAEDTG